MIYFGYDNLVHWTLAWLLYSEMKNFTNNILKCLVVKHRKSYPVSLSWRSFHVRVVEWTIDFLPNMTEL